MTANGATKKPRSRKPKQGFLPDMEPPRIQEIDDAAEKFYDLKLEAKERKEKLDAATDDLIEKLVQHKLKNYRTPEGIEVSLTSTSKVKAKRKGDPESEE